MKTYKCKNCGLRDNIDTENISSGINRFCSKKCRLTYTRLQVTNAKIKQRIKKDKIKDKKHNSISFLTAKADKLWSECVKINFNYICQYTDKGKDEVQLHSHHLFTRSRKSTRWDINNGICLGAGSHTLSSNFSAHKTPLEFAERLEGLKGRDRINELSKKSRQVVKVTPDYIKEKIAELEQFKKDNS